MPLTTYVARHTWATIARDMNVPITIISEGMGHHSYKTTQVYLNSIDTSRINESQSTYHSENKQREVEAKTDKKKRHALVQHVE